MSAIFSIDDAVEIYREHLEYGRIVLLPSVRSVARKKTN